MSLSPDIGQVIGQVMDVTGNSEGMTTDGDSVRVGSDHRGVRRQWRQAG